MVSIVIPAYNAAAFIENCINSILKQRYQDFEIVVVNDGSKDNTLEILERLAKKDDRIKVISQENGGVSAARNTALKHISGEYITYVDADDTVPENSLEDLVALMDDDVDLVVGSHNEVRFGYTPHLEKVNVIEANEISERFREFDPVVWWPWGKLLRASVIKDNNLSYDTSITFGEDHIFNLLYGKYMTGKTVVTDKIVYNYHYIRGGLCSRFYQNMDELQLYVYLKIADFFGGVDSIPEKYYHHYVSSYLKGNVEYYIAWQGFSKAKKSIESCFKLYEPYLDDYIMHRYFNEKMIDAINSGNYGKFIILFCLKRPKQTIWRKVRRTIRRTLEFGQKIFMKRA